MSEYKAIELFKEFQKEIPGCADHGLCSLVLAEVIIEHAKNLNSIEATLEDIRTEISAGTTQISQSIEQS